MAIFSTGQQALLQIVLVMMKFFNTKVGRLRLVALLEGLSLLVLVFIAVPLKYNAHDPSLVKTMGPVHGMLFLFFVVNTISVGIEYHWKFSETTWKVLLACVIPFGTFYIDHTILKKLDTK